MPSLRLQDASRRRFYVRAWKGPMTNLVEFQNVSHTYHLPNGEAIDALVGVGLAIERGEFVALIGANGSGKSTLASLIDGLLVPTEGTVLVNGLDTSLKKHLPEIRRTAAMVFQSPQDQIVGSTVEEDVAFGPENLGGPPDEIAMRVKESLESVGAWHLRHRPPFQLSAGQAQRVAIAGALAMRPEILILDEATSMLDPAGRNSVMEIALRLNAQGMAILLITHFPEEAALADRVVVLRGGEIVADGPPRAIFSREERLRRWGLEPPSVMGMALRLHRVDPRICSDALTVEELADSLARALAGKEALPAVRRTTPTDGKPFLETESLWHVYMAGTPLETVALRGMDFSVAHGGAVGLMGSTGSGKSTLMQHLNGILFPQKGRVLVDGTDILTMRDRLIDLRRNVAMVFQRPEDQVFSRFVGDDVAFGLRKLGLPKDELRERVRAAMESVGLEFERYKDRLTYTLSGGERRKVALAGALALNPQALLLDEPTAGLDPAARREFIEQMKRWRAEKRLTLVYSSHVPEDLAEMVDRLVVMENGRTAMEGSIRDVFGRASEMKPLGLDVPVAVRLAQEVRARGVPLPGGILTAEELVEAVRAMSSRQRRHRKEASLHGRI